MSGRVTIVPYDHAWPRAYELAAAEIAAAMGESLIELHHIGSTAIPAMHAKPVIDMLAVVAELAALDNGVAQMEALGYEAMGEFGIPGRRYFRRDGPDGRRTHQLHAFARGSPHVRRHLAFRDFMRAHPTCASDYAALKQTLAAAHPNDIEAYMDGKDAFIKEMERRALSWASIPSPGTPGEG